MNGLMLKILCVEAKRLRQEESGVALMLTLSVFLLLFVVCAGVYSVGETVRQKVELQNACDSAAYSAALVQADGLSRMAMINRAMSWTYVQLTNMQIDYITYKWMQLVARRFGEDRQNCISYNSGSSFSGTSILAGRACSNPPAFRNAGAGWFCGLANTSLLGLTMPGLNKVRMNNSNIVDYNEVGSVANSASATMENYTTLIPQFKSMISVYNLMLCDVATNMQNAIANTAQYVLLQNLPRNGDGTPNTDLAKDFLGYRDVGGYSFSPYSVNDEGELEGQGNWFSPLFNTEVGERIFLTMADGKVYDNLVSYFGPQSDGSYRPGGLDQWFIRSYPAESTNSVAKSLAPSFAVKDNLGICRVYKNANRMSSDPGQTLPAYRAHHVAVDSGGDCPPSCVNTKAYCPEQCRQVADSHALYADYEWSSGHYSCRCIHMDHWTLKGIVHDFHIHIYSSSFKGSCSSHQCGCQMSARSHSRSEYNSCVASGKSLTIAETSLPWPPWGGFPMEMGDATAAEGGTRNWAVTQANARFSNACNPNGFARIYGDDREIYNADYYTGEVAQPWILNENFYGRAGAITVGLARRMRNPWTWLLGTISEIAGSSRTGEDGGIYSVFNPASTNSYLVAFSAARAAHRFSGPSGVSGWGTKEYEPRFDRVCEEENFHVTGAQCVCKDNGNQARLGKCWNLCETDWDATLLPVKYAWTLATTDSQSGESTTLDSPGVDANGYNPIAFAAINDWIQMAGEDGSLASAGTLSGSFLYQPAPAVTQKGGATRYALPMSEEDLDVYGGKNVSPGFLDLNSVIGIRIL